MMYLEVIDINVFYLDNNPTKCAQAHYDKHVVKMVLETAQILSTVYHVYNDQPNYRIYKPTHINHPSVKWACESASNWNWLKQLGLALGEEYTHRYGKHHKSTSVIAKMETPVGMPSADFTPPPMVMDDEYKTNDAVLSYRWMYTTQKRDLMSYTNRSKPDWMVSYE